MGARPEFVPELISDLFTWAKETDLHPLVKSGIMHYEIETIHPFADGNGRMGRLWQTLILSKWNDIFAWIPMESVIYEKRQEYYDAIEVARDENDSAPFIEYTLSALYSSVLNQIAIQENSTEANDHVNVVLNGTENLVLEILRKEPSITAEKLAERISKTEKTAKRNIASLKEKGVIEREGSDKVGSWRIIDG